MNFFFAKRLLFISIISLGLSSSLSAQKQEIITNYRNCYQETYSSTRDIYTKEHFFLNTKSGRRITITSNNTEKIDIFRIYGWVVDEWTRQPIEYLFSGNSFLVPFNFKSVLIYSVNNTTSQILPFPSIIHFVDFDFNIISNSGLPPCMTFNALNINLTHNLNGLCQLPIIKIKMPPGSINTWGLGSDFSLNITENDTYKIPLSGLCGVSSDGKENRCYNKQNQLVSCCFTFDFEITLTPCFDDEFCPPVTYKKPYNVCCSCGVYEDPD